MSNEVVVHDDAIGQVVPFQPMDYDQAVLTALGERAADRRRAAGESSDGRRRHGGLLARGARS